MATQTDPNQVRLTGENQYMRLHEEEGGPMTTRWNRLVSTLEMLVASAFSGFVVWHQGLSGSIPLTLATPGHFLEAQVGLISTGSTLFASWSLITAALVIASLPWIMARLHPKSDDDVQEVLRDSVAAKGVRDAAEAKGKKLEAELNKQREDVKARDLASYLATLERIHSFDILDAEAYGGRRNALAAAVFRNRGNRFSHDSNSRFD